MERERGSQMMTDRTEMNKQDQKEFLREKLHELLDTMTDETVETLISYLLWILDTPCNP